MKKLIVIGVTALATLFVVLGVGPSAFAYPEGVCNLQVSAQVVNGGENVTATCTYQLVDNSARRSAASDTTWVMTFNGQTRTGTGETFTATFKAPDVTKPTTFKLTSVGTGDAGKCSRSVNVTVLPNDVIVSPPTSPHMPNTGGPPLVLLIAGFALVIAGAGVVYQSRKAHSAH